MRACWAQRNGDDPKGFQGAEQWQLPPLHHEEDVQGPSCRETIRWSFVADSQGGLLQGDGQVFASQGPSVRSMASSITSRVFVHFFSGYRRPGDLQHQIERHEVIEHLHVFCVSINICLAKEFSDLTDPVNLRWWKDRILSGQLLGIGGGPSCETWSAARLLDDGPAPLRDFVTPGDCRPWGRKRTISSPWYSIGAVLVAASGGSCIVQFAWFSGTYVVPAVGCRKRPLLHLELVGPDGAMQPGVLSSGYV